MEQQTCVGLIHNSMRAPRHKQVAIALADLQQLPSAAACHKVPGTSSWRCSQLLAVPAATFRDMCMQHHATLYSVRSCCMRRHADLGLTRTHSLSAWHAWNIMTLGVAVQSMI
jgi:hypothetical protein